MKLRLWIGGIILLGVLALAGLTFLGHLGRKADGRVVAGEAFLRSGEAERALQEAEAALRLRPNLQNALRLRRDALGANGDRTELEAARVYWERFPSSEALLSLVQAAMRWNDEDVARQALDSLATDLEREELIAEVDQWALRATVSARWGQFAEAAAAFDRALALGYPLNDHARLTLGTLQIQEGRVAEGVAHLEAIPAGSPLASQAVRGLVTHYRQAGDLAGVQRHAEVFFKAPEVNVAEKLVVLDRFGEAVREAWLTATLDWTFRSARTGAGVADLLIWAYQGNRAPGWADEAMASLPDVAFRVHSLRLVQVARTRQLLSAAERRAYAPNLPASGDSFEPVGELLRLALLLDEGNMVGSVRASVLQGRIVSGLREESARIEGVERFAATFGLDAAWEAVLARLLREEPPASSVAIAPLFRIHAGNRDTTALHRLMERALELNPDNLVALNNVVYFGLLLGVETPAMAGRVERLRELRQRDIRFASTYAFALLKQGQADAAWAVLESFPPEVWTSPAVALTSARVLSAVGRNEEARDTLAQVEEASLWPQEQLLYNQLRRHLGQ